jgi:hypothetical protein
MSIFEENKKERNYDDDDLSNSLSSSISEGSNYSNSDHNLYVHEKKCKKVKNKIVLSSRTYFKHRNLIKKVKINCINIYEKLLNSCLNVEKSIFTIGVPKKKKVRDVLRYFKSDISKYRNNLLLQIPMNDLISLFCNFEFLDEYIIKDKKLKLNFLLNITWKEFILYIKYNNRELTYGIKDLIKISKKDFEIFFNYIININYVYDLRPNVDNLYINNLNKVLNKRVKYIKEKEREQNFLNMINNYEGFDIL